MGQALAGARFWALMMHCIATALLLSNRIHVLHAAIAVNSSSKQEDYQHNYDSLMSLISLAMIGFALQILCMIVHFHSAPKAVVLSHLVADSLGTVLVFWIMLDTWSWWMYIVVFVLFVLLPSLLDLSLLLRPVMRRWHRLRAKATSRRR